MLKTALISVVTIPAHTSTILQALDCGVNHSFKRQIQKSVRKTDHADFDGPTRRWCLLKSAQEALDVAFLRTTIKSAFATCGVSPWNASIVLNHETKCNDLPPPPLPKRSAVNIAGRVLTSEDVMNEIKLAKQNSDEKKMAKLEKKEQAVIKKQITLLKKKELEDKRAEKAKSKNNQQKKRKEPDNESFDDPPADSDSSDSPCDNMQELSESDEDFDDSETNLVCQIPNITKFGRTSTSPYRKL